MNFQQFLIICCHVTTLNDHCWWRYMCHSRKLQYQKIWDLLRLEFIFQKSLSTGMDSYTEKNNIDIHDVWGQSCATLKKLKKWNLKSKPAGFFCSHLAKSNVAITWCILYWKLANNYFVDDFPNAQLCLQNTVHFDWLNMCQAFVENYSKRWIIQKGVIKTISSGKGSMFYTVIPQTFSHLLLVIGDCFSFLHLFESLTSLYWMWVALFNARVFWCVHRESQIVPHTWAFTQFCPIF